jgi:hypothetical protein
MKGDQVSLFYTTQLSGRDDESRISAKIILIEMSLNNRFAQS